MDEQRSGAISDSANASTSTIIHSESEARGSTAGSRERSGFTVVRLVLGVLLLTTAGLKLIDPSPDTFSDLDLLSSPRWRMAAIEAEALLGIWLLTGALPRLLWLTALLGFSLLASVSFYLGIEGQSSCGCFGAKLPVSPWYALGLDVAAVASLAWWCPSRRYGTAVPSPAILRRVLSVAVGAGAVLVVGFGGLTWMYGSPYEAILHLRGESVTIDPLLSDLGAGANGETRTFTIRLTNHTDHPVRIGGGSSDCSCVTTDDLPLVLPAKEARSFKVWAKLVGRGGRIRRIYHLYTDDAGQPVIVGWLAWTVIEQP